MIWIFSKIWIICSVIWIVFSIIWSVLVYYGFFYYDMDF